MITPQDAEAIRAYLVKVANDAKDHPPASGGRRPSESQAGARAAPGAAPGPSAGATPPPPALH